MTLLTAFLLLGAAATPTDRFVALVRAGATSDATRLAKGDVAVDPDTAAEAGGATMAFSHALELTGRCVLSPVRSHAFGKFYRLWWNCPVDINKAGAFERVIAKVDVWPAGEKVGLRDFEVARAPSEETLKKELQITPAEAESAAHLAPKLAALAMAGNVAAMRNAGGGWVFIFEGEPNTGAYQPASLDTFVAKIKGCALSRVDDLPFGKTSVIKWVCADQPVPGKSCHDMGYVAMIRGEGYQLMLARDDRYSTARCGQMAPPMVTPPSHRPKSE